MKITKIKNSFLLAFLAFLLVGCTAKDTKTLGGNMMSASGSAGVAGLITFPVGGLIYMAGSSAEEDTSDKIKTYPVTREEISDDSNTTYEYLKVTVSDVDSNVTKDK